MRFNVLISVVMLFAVSSAHAQTDTSRTDSTQIDTVKGKSPAFINVDVLVETEWGDSEKTENVKVYAFLEAEHPHLLMTENKHKRCEIRIIKGMTVKIIDHKTGKRLKTYTVETLK